MAGYFEVRNSEDVTDEIIEIGKGIIDGWYSSGPIDWVDAFDRIESSRLGDGRSIDLGDSFDTPAARRLKRELKKFQAE